MAKIEKIILAAVSDNNIIGMNGKLPWSNIPADMKHFKALTIGHPIMMGRVTAESIGRYLEKRMNIVLTKNGWANEDSRFRICHSIREGFDEARIYGEFMEDFSSLAQDGEKYENRVYIIGGERIYQQTIGLVDRLEMTRVHLKVRGEAHFPKVNWNEWQEIGREDFPSQGNVPAYTLESYVRI